MAKITQILLAVLLCFFSVACSSYGEKEDINEPGALDLILCEEPRPQICTNEYNPVCARLKDGDTRTDATGCTACSDPQVSGYEMGAC